MKFRLKFLSLVLCASIGVPGAQGQPKVSYSDAYTLRFIPSPSMIRGWQLCNPNLMFSGLPMIAKDSSLVIDYTYRPNSSTRVDSFRTSINQRILLPATGGDSVNVSILSHGQNIANAWIELMTIDNTETVLTKKRIDFTTTNSPNCTSISVPLRQAEMLNIVIGASGITKQSASLTLHTVDVRMDNVPLDSFPLRTPDITTSLGNVANLGSAADFAQAANTEHTKIVAFGEATHHNPAIKSLIFDIIFDQIENHGCRLVLLEYYAERVVSYNRFITDESFVLSDDMFYNDQAKEFLCKLRTRNLALHDSEKVKVAGLDYYFESAPLRNVPQEPFARRTTARCIFDHVSRLAPSRWRDTLALLLAEERYAKSIDYLTKNRAQLDLGTADEKIIENVLRTALNVPSDNVERVRVRDSVMWENACFAIENFASSASDRVVVYAHAGHVNCVSTYPAVECIPLGRYMKQHYDNQYRVYMVSGGAKAVSRPYSIENFMSFTPGELLFMLTDKRANRLVHGHFIGANPASTDSYLMNPFRRFDGVILLRAPDDDTSQYWATMERRADDNLKSNAILKDRLSQIKSRLSTGL